MHTTIASALTGLLLLSGPVVFSQSNSWKADVSFNVLFENRALDSHNFPRVERVTIASKTNNYMAMTNGLQRAYKSGHPAYWPKRGSAPDYSNLIDITDRHKTQSDTITMWIEDVRTQELVETIRVNQVDRNDTLALNFIQQWHCDFVANRLVTETSAIGL